MSGSEVAVREGIPLPTITYRDGGNRFTICNRRGTDYMRFDELTECWSALYPGVGNAQYLGQELQQKFQPLAVLKPAVSRIVNFGCWPNGGGFEPCALIWTLDASEVVVVEKKDECVRLAQEKVEGLRKRIPDCFESRLIRFLPRDMTNPIPELSQDYFDLSYCERVLLQVYQEHGEQGLTKAIAQTVRAVRPGGWVIACEQPTEDLPENTGHFFEEAGLTIDKGINRVGILKNAYIYSKPL